MTKYKGDETRISRIYKGGPTYFPSRIATQLKNSTDLESGRRPELKSAEKREVPLVIVELFSIGVEIARRFRYHLLGFWVSVESPRGINKTFGSRPCHRSDELI